MLTKLRTLGVPLSLLLATAAAAQAPSPEAGAPSPEAPPPGPPPPPLPPPPSYATYGQPIYQPPMETLVSGPIVHGGYGGPVTAFSRVNGTDSFFMGGKGGWILNHQVVIGAAGYGLVNDVDAPAAANLDSDEHRLNFGYGGLWLEYLVFPRRLVHGGLGLLVGGGGAAYHGTRHNTASHMHGSSGLFVLEPSIEIEFNVAPFIRLDLAGGYRLVRGVDLVGLEDADLSGPLASLMLKFGVF